MKKYFSNIRTLAALLMAGAAFTACSSDDNISEQPANPAGEKVYTLTVNATKDVSATTRGLEFSGDKLVAKWTTSDQIYVIKLPSSSIGYLQPTNISADGNSATFTGTITTSDLNVGDNLILSYHYHDILDFANQDGTLKDYSNSAENYDMATATVKVASIVGSNITTTAPAIFNTETAMIKLTLSDGTSPINATSLNVKATITVGGFPVTENVITFTPTATTYTANGNGILYFALPSAATLAGPLAAKYSAAPYNLTITASQVETLLASANVTFTASDGVNTYTVDKTGYPFAAGSYYTSTLAMAPAARALSEATTADYGKVVCAAGHLHDAKTAVPSGCTAVGILGKVTATGHGLILALQDAPEQEWNTINGWTSVDTYAGTTLKQLSAGALGSLTSYTTLGSTAVSDWCVAQKSDYEAIFINLGSAKYDSDGYTYDANVNAYINTDVGGTAISGSGVYWSATEDGSSYVWAFSSDFWNRSGKSSNRSIRPVLGF